MGQGTVENVLWNLSIHEESSKEFVRQRRPPRANEHLFRRLHVFHNR